MGDHTLRYGYVAAFLSAARFEVYANDDHAHARTARNLQSFGDFGPGGWNALIADSEDDLRMRQQRATTPSLQKGVERANGALAAFTGSTECG